MPRNIDPVLLAALSAGFVQPVHLVQVTFRSKTCYIWSGVGGLLWNGNVFLGVGSLGAVGDYMEGVDLRADGSGLTLSGIDPVWLGEALDDVWLGAPAYRWLGAVQPGTRTLIGTPYLLFSGQVDKPTVTTGPEKVSITLPLETRLINGARPNGRLYTANDQHSNGYPDDTGFNWVESLNCIALGWGS
jgi:hypothetical protein